MTDLPLVSIVTPSFNQAHYLEEAMLSVLNQDYPAIEYLIADGGSTDGSLEIIQKYANRLAWWVCEPDRGQADAINKGLARARGEYVAWLNSDDAYLPGAVSAAVKALQADATLGLVYGDVFSIDENGRAFNKMQYGDWGLDGLMSFHIIGQPGVFMRRSVQAQVGELDTRYHYMLDHQLWLRIAALSPIHYVNQTWARARFHPAAKNVAQAAAFGRDAYAIVDWMQAQPALAERFQRQRRKILAGAHRINARYLLDGGQPRQALAAYWRSFTQHPPTALAEGHRALFALGSLLGLGSLKPFLLRLRHACFRQPDA
jgi:glycosyltransferase involved in cell wall biosynthesis